MKAGGLRSNVSREISSSAPEGFRPKLTYYRMQKWLWRTFGTAVLFAMAGTVMSYAHLHGPVMYVPLSVAILSMVALIPIVSMTGSAKDREESGGYTTLTPPNEANVAEVDPWTGAVLRESGYPPLSKEEWRRKTGSRR